MEGERNWAAMSSDDEGVRTGPFHMELLGALCNTETLNRHLKEGERVSPMPL